MIIAADIALLMLVILIAGSALGLVSGIWLVPSKIQGWWIGRKLALERVRTARWRAEADLRTAADVTEQAKRVATEESE